MEIIKNAQNAEAFSFVVPLVDAMSRPDYKANPTLAAGDIKVIRYDTAAWDVSNIATLPSTIAGATSLLEVELTIAEMTADDDTRPIIVQFIDQTSPKEWDDQMVVIRLGAIQSNLKEIDDESVASNAATLKLKQLDIQNSAGSALIAKGTGGNGSGMELVGHGTGAGLKLTGGATGKDIEASEIGVPIDLGDGESLAEMLTAIAGKSANASTYDRTTDSQESLQELINALPEAAAVNSPNDETYNVVGYEIVTGAWVSGTSADTKVLDSPLVFSPSDPDVLDVNFEFELIGYRPSELIFVGRYDGSGGAPSGRYADVYAWNYETFVWSLLTSGADRISQSTDNVNRKYVLQEQHQDPITGIVKIRYVSSKITTTDRFYIDLHLVSGVRVGATLGDIASAVWSHDIRNRTLDETHLSSGFFLARSSAEWGVVTNVTGPTVTMSGDLFRDMANLYNGRLVQFHEDGEQHYETRRIVSQAAGGVLTLDAAPILVQSSGWHGYVLPDMEKSLQDIRDSMKLAPTAGAPVADSVDQHLDDIITDIATVDGKVDTAIADVAAVDGKVDTAIADVAAVDGKVDSVQTTVDGISNVTRLTASVAGYYLVPAAGSTYHYIQVAVKNTDGSMEDPDGQDFGIRLSGSSSGTILNRLLKTSGGVNLDASGVANCDYKLERNGVGLYSMWYKSTTADTNETLSFRFGWEENALVLYELRPSQTVDIAPATTVLADNAVNKDIIAEALKERDVSGTSAVSGSIYHDVMTDVATAITDIATVDGKVDTVIVDIGNLNDLSIIDVEGAVDDKLEELIAEPSVGVPAATQSVRGILAYWWQILRNKGTMSKSTGDKVFHNSTGTAMFKKHTQDDGTTYVENEASSV